MAIPLLLILLGYPVSAEGVEPLLVKTHFPWKPLDHKTISVSIFELTPISADQVISVKNAIDSYGTIKFRNSETFVGWNEALQSASRYQTTFPMPSNIAILSENNEDADVVIYVSDEKNPVYSGYTSNIIEDHKIVKSKIIIYDITNLDQNQISSIVRHEFGHALGLKHADSPNDLMFSTVQIPSYITECDIDALISLYDGTVQGTASCVI